MVLVEWPMVYSVFISHVCCSSRWLTYSCEAVSTVSYALASSEEIFWPAMVKGASPRRLRIALSTLEAVGLTVKLSRASPACQKVSRYSSRDRAFSAAAESSASGEGEALSAGKGENGLCLTISVHCSFGRPRNLKMWE